MGDCFGLWVRVGTVRAFGSLVRVGTLSRCAARLRFSAAGVNRPGIVKPQAMRIAFQRAYGRTQAEHA